MTAHVSQVQPPPTDWNEVFVEMLPSILHTLRFEFRKLDDERREDATNEAIANCFVAFRRLVDQGRGGLAYPTVLARYAAAQVREGRRVGGKLTPRTSAHITPNESVASPS